MLVQQNPFKQHDLAMDRKHNVIAGNRDVQRRCMVRARVRVKLINLWHLVVVDTRIVVLIPLPRVGFGVSGHTGSSGAMLNSLVAIVLPSGAGTSGPSDFYQTDASSESVFPSLNVRAFRFVRRGYRIVSIP